MRKLGRGIKLNKVTYCIIEHQVVLTTQCAVCQPASCADFFLAGGWRRPFDSFDYFERTSHPDDTSNTAPPSADSPNSMQLSRT